MPNERKVAKPKKSKSLQDTEVSSLKSLTVVAETDHYVVVDKPALLDSQNSKESRGSVVDWLVERYKFAGLVHRLDFGTSGLMVCAKTAAAARQLTESLQAGRITRIYQAVVLGKILPDSGEFNTPLEGQPALTHYRVLERFTNSTLVEVKLETGRKHQIRRHFADAGYPLLGDHLHGKKGSDRLFHRPALHAAKLIILGHGADREFKSPLPGDLEELILQLRKTSAKHS